MRQPFDALRTLRPDWRGKRPEGSGVTLADRLDAFRSTFAHVNS
jgi:hypothetical protein